MTHPHAPVPYRFDGWTPARQAAFIEALGETASVTRAAARVKMSTQSAYRLRRRVEAEAFRNAWDAALAEAERRRVARVRAECKVRGRARHGELR